MKVRAMRVRARPGQRRMVARYKWNRALDGFASGTVTAMVDAHNNFVQAVNGIFREVLLETIRPVISDVLNDVKPGDFSMRGATTSVFAARKWSGQP